MTIPHDIENRWWVEASSTSPVLVDSFRPVLVAFLAFDKNKTPRMVGTGFVVAAASDFALVVSAKHVFTEGVMKAQRPHPMHAPNALFIRKQDKIPSLEPDKLKLIWMGSKNAAMLNATHVCYNDTLDIASCIVMTQEGESFEEKVSIPLDTDVPGVDEVVHMVALEDMNAQELAPPNDGEGKGQVISVFRRVSIRVGVVTAVYPNGFRQYKWPCFTTSIPAKPGMSGGFVYWPRKGKTIAACGVVSADNSTEKAHLDSYQCGESVIGSAWPAFSLRIPQTVPSHPDASTYTLFEMVNRGLVPQPLGGIEQIMVIETGNGDSIIKNIGIKP